jgi:hypothetical protein
MKRKITFTPEGHIHIESEFSVEIVRCGVVLLTSEQVAVALQHGWQRHGTRPFTTVTAPPLYAVRKMPPAGTPANS